MAKQSAQDVIDQLAYQDPGFEDPEDPTDEEVDQRLATAQYYKLLLKQDLFDDASGPAQQVQDEVREFIRARVKVLMGLQPAKLNVVERDPVFSADEILALKELASRLLGGAYQKAEEPVKAPVSPVVQSQASLERGVTLIEKKRPGPKPGAKYGPRKPALRKVSVPDDLRNDSEAPAPAKTAQSKPASVAKPGAIEPGSVGSDEIVELDPNPRTGARRVRKNGKVLEQATDPNDGAILENEHGGEIWLDVTGQTRPATGFVPMPQASSQPGAPMEQVGMQEVLNNQTRMSSGPLSDVIGSLIRS